MRTDTRLGAGGTREDTGRALPLRKDGGNGGGVKCTIEGPAAPEPEGAGTGCEAEAGLGAMGTATGTGCLDGLGGLSILGFVPESATGTRALLIIRRRSARRLLLFFRTPLCFPCPGILG